MLRAVGLAGEARIFLEHFFMADDAEKTAPLLVVVYQQAQITVFCFVWIAVLGEQARVTHGAERRLKRFTTEMLAQHELGKAFEHGDFDGLAAAGALAMK